MTMVRLLTALDIGNVCIRLHFERSLNAFGIREYPPEVKSLDAAYSTGAVDTSAWLAGMRSLTGGRMDDSQIMNAWNAMLGEVIPGMTEAVTEAVRLGVRFIFFSDTSPCHMTHIRRTLPFCHLVTGAVLSYETGARKPDQRMYQAFEREYGKPDIYFDDLACNIESGLAAGWHSVRYQGPEHFLAEIRKAVEAGF